MDSSGYEASNVDDIEFFWDYPQLEVDAVFRPEIDTPFSPTAFNSLETGGWEENRMLLNDEADKDNSPLTTPVPERPIEPFNLLPSCAFAAGIESFPDYINGNLFQ